MSVLSPLEQFTLITIVPWHVGNYYLSFTNSSAFMILSGGIFVALVHTILLNGGLLVPTHWQSVIELYYEAVLTLVKEQLGEAGKRYFPFIFTLFTFVLVNNLIGLVPYSFTTTSHAIIALTLSFTVFIGATIIGITIHKHRFLGLFLPPGAPIQLGPLLVVIEVISYFFRAISLGVRLFANMLSGHCLVKILAGFGWAMIEAGGTMLYAAIPLLVILSLIFVLEMGVTALQAYIFSILTCIYIKDAIELH